MRSALILLLCVGLFSCQDKQQEQIPDYLISEDQMVAIMVDMHLIETAQNLKIIEPDTTNAEYHQLFESVFLTHGVTKTAFDSSMYYYATRSDQMHVIYDKVLEELSEMESEVKSDQ